MSRINTITDTGISCRYLVAVYLHSVHIVCDACFIRLIVCVCGWFCLCVLCGKKEEMVERIRSSCEAPRTKKKKKTEKKKEVKLQYSHKSTQSNE